MALAYRSNTITINSTGSTSCVVSAPAGLADDDILILALERADVDFAGITWPSGFTELFSTPHDGGDTSCAWKRASSESGSYTTSWLASATRNVGIMYAISGADTSGTPFTTGTTATGSGTAPDPPNVDPGSSDDRLAVVIYGQEGEAATRYTPPSGYTEPSNSDGGTTGGGDAALHCGLGLAYRTYTGQAENPGTASSSVSDGWATNTLVFDPAPEAYSLTADSGSFVLTGTASTLEWAADTAVDSGSFVLTGIDATLNLDVAYSLPKNALPGSFVLMGADLIALDWDKAATTDADSGSFVLTGQDATLILGGNTTTDADSGSFVLTGIDATFDWSRTTDADSGSFVLNGIDAVLSWTPSGGTPYVLDADSATFNYFGLDLDLQVGQIDPPPTTWPIWKNNGPGGCCCVFCPDNPESLTSYFDDFSGDFSGWYFLPNPNPINVQIINEQARFGAPGGVLYQHFKCESHTGLTIDFQANLSQGLTDSRIGIFSRRNGPAAERVMLSQHWFNFSGDDTPYYQVWLPFDNRIRLPAPEPADNDLCRVSIKPTTDDYKFDIDFYVNDAIVYQAFDVTFNYNHPTTTPPPCKIEMGIIAVPREFAIPDQWTGYADNYVGVVGCDA